MKERKQGRNIRRNTLGKRILDVTPVKLYLHSVKDFVKTWWFLKDTIGEDNVS